MNVLRPTGQALERDLPALQPRISERARPVPECLRGLACEDSQVRLRPLHIERLQGGVQTAAGDVPGFDVILGVIIPLQVLADLVETAVDDHPVFGDPAPVGPLTPDLEANRVSVGNTGTGAPVPLDVVWPAAASVVEDGPGPLGHIKPLPLYANPPGHWKGNVLHRVLEAVLVPRDDDGQ